MTENRVQIRDNGWDKILREMQSGKRMNLTVGILPEEAALVHPRSGDTLGSIACKNEYGEGNIPSRSMIRTWVDTNSTKMKEELVRAYSRVIRAKMDRAVEKAELSRLGKKYVKQVQGRIERRRIPPVSNRPFTIRRKGFDHPLIETRLLINSFKFKVAT